MIAHINGTVDFIGKDHLVIDANGIGYKVFVSPQIIASLGIIRSKVKIFTEQIVREDSLSLYGFQMKEEKALFNSLLGVSGIGPKSAMSIISGLPFDSLVSAIAGGKGDVISSIPGVGLKTAQRLIIELKEKVVKEQSLKSPPPIRQRRRERKILSLFSFIFRGPQENA